ncbi:hypothetical protein BWI06_RS22955 [Vibrio parahaemolyticus]|uniref:hypothetical protein n=1 Tax=Vibrio parahaemolyticus TaxID=670 RepID=UPI001120D609|nr:hypothetical protein [Vibrio parahaemolyticus]EJE4561536.1 hypothetical protein [Vibrio parahaemolyticus]EJG1768145.1 hypothetical protein [Vibrio parahaemolyticus]ELA7366388.1 hypothetical protein [Vibrio parahaemolyticus]TOI39475.1 hypothetical protein CGI60_22650 [Vibrio parahaemolyticus]HCE5173176.1 hypothetical protein [Vibrio parahaemolyticus]
MAFVVRCSLLNWALGLIGEIVDTRKLFRVEDSYPYGNALLNYQSNAIEEVLDFAASYRRAAMALVAGHDRQKVVAIDNAALPIVFLYRHSFELYLKAMVYHSAAVTINKSEISDALPKLWKGHSLVKLVKMVSPVIKPSPSNNLVFDGELYEKILSVATQIDAIDDGSYSFRYPITSKEQASLPSHFMFNIFIFSEVVENMLDDVSQICRSLRHGSEKNSCQMKLSLPRVIVK